MEQNVRTRLATGILFIVLGLGLYGMQFLDNMGESITLLLLGGLCVAAYLYIRSRFLLIVGCVVTGLGIGSFGERTWSVVGEFSKLGLGIGFILIYVISLLWEKRAHWWPLIPGTILLLLGFNAWRRFYSFLFSRGWPLILVGIGVLILLGSFGWGRKAGGKPTGPA